MKNVIKGLLVLPALLLVFCIFVGVFIFKVVSAIVQTVWLVVWFFIKLIVGFIAIIGLYTGLIKW